MTRTLKPQTWNPELTLDDVVLGARVKFQGRIRSIEVTQLSAHIVNMAGVPVGARFEIVATVGGREVAVPCTYYERYHREIARIEQWEGEAFFVHGVVVSNGRGEPRVVRVDRLCKVS